MGRLAVETFRLGDGQSLLLGDAGDGTLKYDGTDLVIDPQAVGGGNVKINAGSLDLNNQGGLLNVGSAGNDWTATSFTRSGSNSADIERTAAATNVLVDVATFIYKSSGDGTDGIGPQIRFEWTDTGVTDQFLGGLGFRRAGADNTADFVLTTVVTGSGNEAFKVSSAGEGFFDAAGSGDGIPTLFDDYDDPAELQRYARSSLVPDEHRQAHLDRMVEIGIFEKADSVSGYMLKLQPLTRLLAGGVYQNRQLMDDLRKGMDARLMAVEEDMRTMRAQVIELGGIPRA